MDRSTHATPGKQFRVGGVHDRVGPLAGDVALNEFDSAVRIDRNLHMHAKSFGANTPQDDTGGLRRPPNGVIYR
jgi:hypothetical protein